MAQTLASYRLEVRRMLHEATPRYWSNTELNDYINDGRLRVCSDTGCLRRLITAYLSVGLEQYPIGGVTGGLVTLPGSSYTNIAITVVGDGGGAQLVGNLLQGKLGSITTLDPGQGYSTASLTITGDGLGAAATAGLIPVDTLDIMNVSPIWGNQRWPLRYMPFTEFNARMRSFFVNPQLPMVWSRYGTSGGSAFVQPVPDQTYTTEFDTAVLPNALTDDTTPDILQYPYTAPVAFYACWKAKHKQQMFGEGEIFLKDYARKILEAQAAVQMRRIPNPYYGYSGA